MSWSDLIGEHVLTAINVDVRHPFSADANGVAIELDNRTVLAFEDPNDGYRSSCSGPIIIEAPMHSFGASPDYLRIPVLVSEWTQSESGCGADGIEIKDRRNGKTILLLGTDNLDDYYPSFTCDWRPQNIFENENGLR